MKLLMPCTSNNARRCWETWMSGQVVKARHDLHFWAVHGHQSVSVAETLMRTAACDDGWLRRNSSPVNSSTSRIRAVLNLSVSAGVCMYTQRQSRLFMVALCNTADHYVFMPWFVVVLLLLFSSPNLSGRRLDVYHTSTHGVALVQI